MDSIPAQLLELQTRLDAWRADRKYLRQPLPDELRKAALELSRRYPPSLLRRVLKIDPWRLNKELAVKRSSRATARESPPPAFFKLPEMAVSPVNPSSPQTINDCRLQLERPDGARLTFTLPALEISAINLLCFDFLRASNP